jgi:hypothetical protein
VAERKRARSVPGGDGLDGDFGPGSDPSGEPAAGPAAGGTTESGDAGRQAPFAGLGAGIPCGKDGCFLKPVGDLATRFAVQLARRGHADSATRAAVSGIELLKALRDFLDEEIAFAERAAEKQRASARYTKIPVE